MAQDPIDHAAMVTLFKTLFDRMIEAEAQPVVVTHTRDGWAGYQAGRRVTRFCFSAERAQQLADDEWKEA